ncbi:MAG: hypothetical protein COA99_13575 [Moraxellaceae bacterium]|nr:MAG: hypothetical protein COA99_13575 [Moraxellaceae bacterium]
MSTKTNQLICPRCFFLLMKEKVKGHDVDHCIRCGGTFLEKGKENAILGKTASPDIWKETEICEKKPSQKLICPKDHHTLNTYRVTFDESNVEVDTCPACDGLWLDPQEGKKLLDIVLHAGQNKDSTFSDTPGIRSYLFQAFSGMPVEAWNPVHHRPVLTLGLIGILITAFIMQLTINGFHELLVLVPVTFLAGDQLWTLISAGFLHGSVAHLLGNLYFLYIFGDNVEDYLGRARFVFLYLSALIISTLSFTLIRSDLEHGFLGASGAIAGLMGAYLALFPKIKLYFTVFFIPIRLNVVWYLAAWLAFNISMMVIGVDGIAWTAHIAGFIAGLILGTFFQFQSIQQHIQSQ